MKLPKRVLAKKNATRSLPGIGISFCFNSRTLMMKFARTAVKRAMLRSIGPARASARGGGQADVY
jgi:hypothetical protein